MTDGKLAGKVAIITGGTSGIGKAATLAFAREGASVVIGARKQEAGDALVRQIAADGRGEALFASTDVSQPEQIENLVEQAVGRFGRVDILYGNAGVLYEGTAPDTTPDMWRRTIDINLGGQFYLAKYGIPALINSGGGVIILTASELGLVGASQAVAYCASKGGVINMARALAIDCAPHGIRVNCLAPGPVETPMLRDWFDSSENPEEMERAQKKPVLLKRFATPEEIARVAVFLAGDDSSFMTGSVVVADGGATAWYGL